MIAPQQEQLIPVRMYQGEDRVMVAAPMPGLEPENISVTVRSDTLIIRGEYRGPHQEERDLLIAEWAIGPYYRELELPQAVDGTRTNATYGNGVLVLAMPKLEPGQAHSDCAFQLQVVTATRGERVGHSGRDLHETSTEDHLRQLDAHVQRASQTG